MRPEDIEGRRPGAHGHGHARGGGSVRVREKEKEKDTDAEGEEVVDGLMMNEDGSGNESSG